MSDGFVSAWAPDVIGLTPLGQPVWSKAHEPPASVPRLSRPKRFHEPGAKTKRARLEPGEMGPWGRTAMLTQRDIAAIGAGLHPAGEAIRTEEPVRLCRSCAFAIIRSDCGNRAGCGVTKHQIRPGWPACVRWESKNA